MSLRPPCELIVKGLIPSVRALIAHELYREGYSQNTIAKMLGITQASVNYYLSLGVSGYRRELDVLTQEDPHFDTVLRTLINYIKSGESSSALTLLCSYCLQLRASKTLCKAHVEEIPQLKDCSVCSSLIGGFEVKDLEVIKTLKLATIILEHSKHFPYVIPEVNTNIAMAKESPKSIRDIAAIPGRIVKVIDRAKAVSEPRFGASKHLAKILLAATKINPNIRAAINIKYDRYMKEALIALGMKFVHVRDKPRGRYVSDDVIVNEIALTITRLKEVPEALIDLGGVGYEPALYIFGEDAVDVAQKAISLASAYIAISSRS